MNGRRRGWVGCLSLAFLLIAATSHAYEQRRNTVSIGIQGVGGVMSGTDEYVIESGNLTVPYEDYEFGPGIAINFKYSIDRRNAVGITFDDLRFDKKSGLSADTPDQIQFNNVLGRFYKYFNRRGRMSRNVFIGAGFHRAVFRVNDRENIFPGEGFTANYGAGLEYFLNRVATIDLTVEGYYMKPKGGTAATGQVKLGLHYYFTR